LLVTMYELVASLLMIDPDPVSPPVEVVTLTVTTAGETFATTALIELLATMAALCAGAPRVTKERPAAQVPVDDA